MHHLPPRALLPCAALTAIVLTTSCGKQNNNTNASTAPPLPVATTIEIQGGVDPLDNGALWYLRLMMFSPFQSPDMAEAWLAWLENPTDEPAAAAEVDDGEAISGAVAQLVVDIERAQDCTVCQWPVYVEPSPFVMIPYAGAFRPMTRLLIADAKRLLDANEDDAQLVAKAAQRITMAIRAAQDLSHIRSHIASLVSATILEESMPIAERVLVSPLLTDFQREAMSRTLDLIDRDDPFLIRSFAALEHETMINHLRLIYTGNSRLTRFNEEFAKPYADFMGPAAIRDWPPSSEAELDAHFAGADRYYAELHEAMQQEDFDRARAIGEAGRRDEYGALISVTGIPPDKRIAKLEETRTNLDRLRELLDDASGQRD